MTTYATKLTLFASLLCALSAATAQASTGIVSGRLEFYQNQGGYCPSDRDCTGARYTARQFHTNQPVRNARIRVVRASDGSVIGQGATSARGFFEIRWNDPAASGNVAARLEFHGEHADGRFKIVNGSGGSISPLTYRFLARQGFTWLNFATFGRASAPNDLANLFDGAQMMWQNSIGQSAKMLAGFTGVTIAMYDPFACPTSCANGPANAIIIDSIGSAYNPQSRILHELGHIANFVANPNWKQLGGFNYDFGGSGGWSLDSPEFESAGWEESIATHAGDVALYGPDAKQPHTCFASELPCSAGVFNIESAGDCTEPDSNRQVINHIRFHWDVYDTVKDSDADSVSAPIAALWDVLGAFPNIDGEGGINEFWNPTGTSGDDDDGRCALDFASNWVSLGGPDTKPLVAANCGSAGD
jgi:hypothetical protein